jgi:RimJ/RimL family protein N-acetyltransferase
LILDPIPGGRYILADEPKLFDWIAERIPAMGKGYVWEMAYAIGLVSDGKLIAAMAVQDYCPHYKSCQLTFCASTPAWATRESIKAMLRYPLVQLGCERLTCVIARSNVRAIRVNERLGFKHEGTLRRGAGHEDALVFGLLKEEAPAWLGFGGTPFESLNAQKQLLTEV